MANLVSVALEPMPARKKRASGKSTTSGRSGRSGRHQRGTRTIQKKDGVLLPLSPPALTKDVEPQVDSHMMCDKVQESNAAAVSPLSPPTLAKDAETNTAVWDEIQESNAAAVRAAELAAKKDQETIAALRRRCNCSRHEADCSLRVAFLAEALLRGKGLLGELRQLQRYAEKQLGPDWEQLGSTGSSSIGDIGCTS